MNPHRLRQLITVFLAPGAMFATIVVVPALYADRLPTTIARHWNLSGEPDGASKVGVIVALSAGFAGLAWLSLIVANSRNAMSSELAATIYFVESLFAAVMAMTVSANLDIDSWQQAEHIGFGAIGLVLGIAGLAGAAGWFLAAPISEPQRQTTTVSIPTLGKIDASRTVWFGTVDIGFFQWLSPLLLVAALVIGGVAAVILIAIAVLLFFFFAGRVVVSERGVSIGLGQWGWPKTVIPIDNIQRAEVVDVVPMSYGGWGLRFRGRGDSKVRALVVRGGPGLKLVRDGQADIVVTIDGPEPGAGLINDLIRQQGRLPPTRSTPE